MNLNDAVGKAISAERAIAKLTVKELSEKSGIPERSLVRILQAERDIKVPQVAAIAEALNIYPHEIIEAAELLMAREVRNRDKPATITELHPNFNQALHAANPDKDDQADETQE